MRWPTPTKFRTSAFEWQAQPVVASVQAGFHKRHGRRVTPTPVGTPRKSGIPTSATQPPLPQKKSETVESTKELFAWPAMPICPEDEMPVGSGVPSGMINSSQKVA